MFRCGAVLVPGCSQEGVARSQPLTRHPGCDHLPPRMLPKPAETPPTWALSHVVRLPPRLPTPSYSHASPPHASVLGVIITDGLSYCDCPRSLDRDRYLDKASPWSHDESRTSDLVDRSDAPQANPGLGEDHYQVCFGPSIRPILEPFTQEKIS